MTMPAIVSRSLRRQPTERRNDERPDGRADPAGRQQHAVAVDASVDDPARVGRHHGLVAHADEAEKRDQCELSKDPPIGPSGSSDHP